MRDVKQELEQISEKETENWRFKAKNCPETYASHDYQAISWIITPKTKNVSTLMCMKCFHEINITDVFQHRVKL